MATMSESVFAYIDPGTGSLIIQGLLAAIAGAFVTIKLYWYKIKSLFRRSQSDKNHGQNNSEDKK